MEGQDKIRQETLNSVRNIVRHKIYVQAAKQVNDRVWKNAWNKVSYQVFDSIRDLVGLKVRYQIWHQIEEDFQK